MKRALSSVLVLVVSLSLSLAIISCTKKKEEEKKEGVAEVIDGAMEKAQEVKKQAAEKASEIQEQAGEVVEGAKERAGQVAEAVKEKAGEMSEGAKNMAEDATQKAQEIKEGAAEMAGDAKEKAKEMGREAKEMVVAEAPTTKGDPTKGKEKFELICASCHGPEGHGDGPAAAALDPKPRNLSDAAYVSGLTDEHIFKTVKEGGAAVGKSAGMPAWGSVLSDEDIWNVIAYLREDICKCQHKGN